MLVFFIIGAIVGILLGLRFKVFVLAPATLLAILVVIVSSHGVRFIALAILGTVVLLQVGYIAGCLLGVLIRGEQPVRKMARYSPVGRNRHIEMLNAVIRRIIVNRADTGTGG